MALSHFEPLRPDYQAVPPHLKNRVCGCRSRIGFVNNQHSSRPNPDTGVPFEWWVCYECLLPAPLNALNARLIRECESCEEGYFVTEWPDFMNLCEGCNG